MLYAPLAPLSSTQPSSKSDILRSPHSHTALLLHAQHICVDAPPSTFVPGWLHSCCQPRVSQQSVNRVPDLWVQTR